MITTRFLVRSYEVDRNGHLNGSIYVQWADEVRFQAARQAGVDVNAFIAGGVGPVNLETTIRYHRELREGDEVDVSCVFEWGNGKTVNVYQEFRRPDGTLAATLTSTGGLLDLDRRRLLDDPAGRWRTAASEPAHLGL